MISEFWSLWTIVLYTTIISMPYLRLAHKLNKSYRAKKLTTKKTDTVRRNKEIEANLGKISRKRRNRTPPHSSTQPVAAYFIGAPCTICCSC
jgi:hypothetical protein